MIDVKELERVDPNIALDSNKDVLRIFGVDYSLDLFRQFAFAAPGTWLRIETRGAGWFDAYEPDDLVERSFDYIAKRGIWRANSS